MGMMRNNLVNLLTALAVSACGYNGSTASGSGFSGEGSDVTSSTGMSDEGGETGDDTDGLPKWDVLPPENGPSECEVADLTYEQRLSSTETQLALLAIDSKPCEQQICTDSMELFESYVVPFGHHLEDNPLNVETIDPNFHEYDLTQVFLEGKVEGEGIAETINAAAFPLYTSVMFPSLPDTAKMLNVGHAAWQCEYFHFPTWASEVVTLGQEGFSYEDMPLPPVSESCLTDEILLHGVKGGESGTALTMGHEFFGHLYQNHVATRPCYFTELGGTQEYFQISELYEELSDRAGLDMMIHYCSPTDYIEENCEIDPIGAVVFMGGMASYQGLQPSFWYESHPMSYDRFLEEIAYLSWYEDENGNVYPEEVFDEIQDMVFD